MRSNFPFGCRIETPLQTNRPRYENRKKVRTTSAFFPHKNYRSAVAHARVLHHHCSSCSIHIIIFPRCCTAGYSNTQSLKKRHATALCPKPPRTTSRNNPKIPKSSMPLPKILVAVVVEVLLVLSLVDAFVVQNNKALCPSIHRQNVDNNGALFLSSVGADEFLVKTPTRSGSIDVPARESTTTATNDRGNEDAPVTEFSSATTAAMSPASLSMDDESTTILEAEKATSTREFTPFQQVVRALPIVTTAAYLYDPKPLDDLVANIYSAIY